VTSSTETGGEDPLFIKKQLAVRFSTSSDTPGGYVVRFRRAAGVNW